MIIAEAERRLRIGNDAIPFLVVKGRPNRIRLSFNPENHLQIETGTGALGKFERDFLVNKATWIVKAYRIRKDAHHQKSRFLEDVENSIQVLGRQTPVEFVADTKTYFKYSQTGNFRVFAPARFIRAHKKKVLYFALRKFSELYLAQRLEYWSKVTNLHYNRLVVKDLRSKWGSCSSLRNINLNWQLILLEDALIDYVVIHELMHLHEMNHSPAFWAWVGKYCPNYPSMRKKLKEQQWLVGILN